MTELHCLRLFLAAPCHVFFIVPNESLFDHAMNLKTFKKILSKKRIHDYISLLLSLPIEPIKKTQRPDLARWPPVEWACAILTCMRWRQRRGEFGESHVWECNCEWCHGFGRGSAGQDGAVFQCKIRRLLVMFYRTA